MNLQQREWFRRAGLLEFFGGAAGRNDTAQQTADAVANMRGDRVDILTKMAKDSFKKVKTTKEEDKFIDKYIDWFILKFVGVVRTKSPPGSRHLGKDRVLELKKIIDDAVISGDKQRVKDRRKELRDIAKQKK